MHHPQKSGLIVIGASSGGMKAVMHILSGLKDSFILPVVIVLHQLKHSSGKLVEILQSKTILPVKEPIDKEKIEKGTIYIAPPDYHLLVEGDRSFSYSYSEPVNYSRPSIDVLFETAAMAYKEYVTGILLTGASEDGARGMQRINLNQGFTIVEDPESAEMPVMPRAAIQLFQPDRISHLNQISTLLNKLEYGCKTTERCH